MTLISKTDQSVAEARTTIAVNDDDVQAGYNDVSEGTNSAGGFLSFPPGASLGSFRWYASNNSGNYQITTTNASFGQSTALTVPDPGAATAIHVLDTVSGFLKYAVTNITASTTHSQGGATPILSGIAVVITANASDAVLLPAITTAMIGVRVQLINSSATAGVLYASGSNTINGTPGATGVAYAASKTLFLVAISATAWVSTLSN